MPAKKINKSDKKNSNISSKVEPIKAVAKAVSTVDRDDAGNFTEREVEEAKAWERGADIDESLPAEVSAISTETEIAQELNQLIDNEGKSNPKVAKTKKSAKSETLGSLAKTSHQTKKSRSKKYLEQFGYFDKLKSYPLAEAMEIVKKMASVGRRVKFDQSIELHLRIQSKTSKSSLELIKGTLQLPHPIGKAKKIIVLDEAKIDEIARTKKIDFDYAIASPALMPKIAKIAKILGPKGKLPDPKLGTVTDDPDTARKELEGSKIVYRLEANGITHQVIGKASMSSEQLTENAAMVLKYFPSGRIISAYLCATMTPSIKLEVG